MKLFLSLLKTQLNVTYGISALKYRFTKEKKRRWEPILIGVAILFGLGSAITFFTLLMLSIFMAGSMINKPEIVITVAFMTAQLMVLFFGVMYIMGAFYFTKDMDMLIPLPLKPSYVMGSKLAVVILGEYLIIIPLLLPAVLMYGINTSPGLLYWLKAIILALAAPIVPLTVSALFVVVLMRFVNVRRNKDLFTMIGGFLGILLAIGWNTLVQRFPKAGQDEFLVSQIALIARVGEKFPPAIWATRGLALAGIQGLSYFALFLGFSAVLLFILLWLGDRVFYRSILSGQEVVRKRKALSSEDFNKKYGKSTGPIQAIFWREWKLLFRTPIYLLNGITGMLIAPLLLVMPILTNQSDIGQLLSVIHDPANSLPVTLGALGVALLTSNIGILANTAVSREGQSFWISKLIPVSARDQVLGKLLTAVILECLGLVVTGITIEIVFQLPILSLIPVFVLGFLGNVLIATLNLMIDVLRPKLEWTNPQEAVKQNLNGVFGMLVTLLVLAVLAAISVGMMLIRLPGWLVFMILGVIILGAAIPSLLGLFALAERRYRGIEV